MKKFKPKSYNEKYLLKDGNGKVLLKSEDLIRLINKRSWNNLKVVKSNESRKNYEKSSKIPDARGTLLPDKTT